ncbi:50S ribosomal protein L28 [Patescibacteria group bacterium]|nr:50S ribosomal protein L28 [Patescibacteria group bacterium]
MAACQICGKHTSVGRSKRHKRGVAGRRWRKRAQVTPRLFKPNIQVKNLVVNGEKKKMKVCAKCIKRIKKYGSVRNYSNIAVG